MDLLEVLSLKYCCRAQRVIELRVKVECCLDRYASDLDVVVFEHKQFDALGVTQLLRIFDHKLDCKSHIFLVADNRCQNHAAFISKGAHFLYELSEMTHSFDDCVKNVLTLNDKAECIVFVLCFLLCKSLTMQVASQFNPEAVAAVIRLDAPEGCQAVFGISHHLELNHEESLSGKLSFDYVAH